MDEVEIHKGSYLDVSLVVPNYNNGCYLEKCIQSFNGGTSVPQEVLIIDDCSTDDSKTIIEELALRHANIVPIYLDKNVGVGAAVNIGLEHAKCTYIARLDPDDYVAENRFAFQYDFLVANPEIDVVGSNAMYFNNDGKFLTNTHFPTSNDQILLKFRNTDNGVLQGTIMLKSAVAKMFRYHQEEVPAEDYGYYSRIINAGFTFSNVQEPLTFVRVHSNSVTNDVQLETILKMFKMRLQIFEIGYTENEVDRYYLWIVNYRQYLGSNGIKKYLFLLKAIYYNPGKLMDRIRS